MAHIALYRTWRSQLFRDVVGQKHITQTLQNSLREQRFTHAYLFSGPRGTGKTSTAKIFAKAVNCMHGPAEEPCNECSACIRITQGAVMDVIEIDAASNRGVEEIRDIRDKVKYAPTEVRYKVYIIDEVHMLTTEAFNALLKTLEEPPEHVIFILATTEPHKLPATIISRCQRFDFRRISLEEQVQRLRFVCKQEGIHVEDEALHYIGRLSDGECVMHSAFWIRPLRTLQVLLRLRMS
nr:DNA polymerase III subunit gamma/tau [Paenibacillus larvae]